MKRKLHIKGMHCVSCEMILEKEFKKLKGLKTCHVNHKRGNAEIECEEEIPLSKLENVVRECGYDLAEEVKFHPEKKDEIKEEGKPDYFNIALIVIVLAVIFFVAKELEITRLFPNFGSQVNIYIAILLGVVASLSTCLALTGGIVMSFGSMVHVHEGRKDHFITRAMPHIYFHIGRIGGFMLLGGLLGLVGSKINYSLSFTGYLTIVIAFVMLYIGLQILGIVPNISKLGFHLPKFLSRRIHDIDGNGSHFAPIIIGILTFFLPCGFTQSMQLAAVVSGSFVTGALIMGAFALGTVPVLLSVGIGSTYAKKEKMQFFNQLIGVVIIFFSLYSLNSGLVLSGSSFTIDFWNRGGDISASVLSGNSQVIKMDVDWNFQQTEFKVKKGIPVRWEINGINVTGCSNEIVIPKLNIRKKINIGLNVIEFTPEKEGVLTFSCWMGMLNGRIIVTDEKGNLSEKTKYDASQPMPASECDGVSCGGECNGGTGGSACGGGCGG